MTKETIRPGIVSRDYYNGEHTYYPTDDEWLLAFALQGCQWAIDAVETKMKKIEDQWLDSMRQQD